MIRAKVVLNTKHDINEFINCFDGDDYSIVSKDGKLCVSAKSLIGAIYAWTEWDDMYVVNETHDGHFPAAIDKFRAE
jgi:hypothetical protein